MGLSFLTIKETEFESTIKPSGMCNTRQRRPLRKSRKKRVSSIVYMALKVIAAVIFSILNNSCSNNKKAGPSILFVNANALKEITLRAGVLLAPPFAMLEDDGITYTGFQPDLLKRIQIFAMQEENITINFELSQSPPQYASALDIVANDCNTTEQRDNCGKFDLIVGDYYCNADRSVRVDFTPAWLRTTMSTLKYVKKDPPEINNMQEIETFGETACVPEGTYLASVVMGRYPNAKYYLCPSPEDCIESLKSGKCALYAEDELLLRYRATEDLDLKVTKESFNTQYLVWPMSYSIDPIVSSLIKKLFYRSVSNATLDELYYTYFEVPTCPIGFAGEDCTEPCDPDHGKADISGECVCESTKWTGDDCSTEVVEDKNMISSGVQIFGYCLFGFNALVVLICAIWLVWKRYSSYVIVMQPLFLSLILLGCLISSSTIIALAQQDAGYGPVHACVAIPWLYSIGFSITFGSLFAKIRRVQTIFKMSSKEAFIIIGFVVLVDVIILTTWTIVDPLQWTRVVLAEDKFGEPLESEGYCTSERWPAFLSCIAAFHFMLLSGACYLCYVSWNISTEFCEARYIAIALLSNLQIFLIGLPVLAIVGPGGEAAFLVRSLIIWINDLVVVGLIFGHLMYAEHTHDPEPDVVANADDVSDDETENNNDDDNKAEVNNNDQFDDNGLDNGDCDDYGAGMANGHSQETYRTHIGSSIGDGGSFVGSLAGSGAGSRSGGGASSFVGSFADNSRADWRSGSGGGSVGSFRSHGAGSVSSSYTSSSTFLARRQQYLQKQQEEEEELPPVIQRRQQQVTNENRYDDDIGENHQCKEQPPITYEDTTSSTTHSLEEPSGYDGSAGEFSALSDEQQQRHHPQNPL